MSAIYSTSVSVRCSCTVWQLLWWHRQSTSNFELKLTILAWFQLVHICVYHVSKSKTFDKFMLCIAFFSCMWLITSIWFVNSVYFSVFFAWNSSFCWCNVVSRHSATLFGNRLVVFGGWDAPVCYNDLFILDLSKFWFYHFTVTRCLKFWKQLVHLLTFY